MCGITGFIDKIHAGDADWIAQTSKAMADSLVHRGPDDAGVWLDSEAGLGLGFRRLAIIDLSVAGHQPMQSSCGRFIIVYNGETYNANELRNELKHIRFRGHSDTEVVLEACAAWGVETTVKRMNGMFAFAIWDRSLNSLTLARDRLGIKPLYWGKFNGLFLFGSELKALKKHSGWQAEIDHTALAAFMQHRYIPSPRSIYKNIYKLQPGHILTVGAELKIEDKTYWNISDVIVEAQNSQLQLSDNEAIDRLDDLLGKAVQRRMIADVPLGAFLSGGIDSATVVALMQKYTNQPVKTFTIGFEDSRYNEAKEASAIARHLGTEHTELYVGSDQALNVIPLIPTLFDEPFADSSQIPTFLVSQMTREHVTVALSGDGGDELFAGYNRYQTAESLRRWISPLSGSVRKSLMLLLNSISPANWNTLLSFLSVSKPGHKLHSLSDLIDAGTDNIYRELISEWTEPSAMVIDADDSQGILWADAKLNLDDPIEQMQYLDTINYLPDNILTKVDRTSMAVSLEARTPILDHNIVEFAWRLPMQMKIRGKHRKWLLRELACRYIPADMLDKRKTGFSIPVDDWLKTSLREWAESLLNKQRLCEEGFLDAKLIRKKWDEHLSGSRNWKGSIWNVLMFQAWLEAQ